ncbi:hypothetical protein [uncultured Phocaeicola sp.]|uniref:hypothetical protein n=1 Tax=uncultured Phocaeicola sp. TaxID=990718 RepID=UPI0025F1927D|nr:hypothetical protein [uncultured Phocaeicola sp.]
MDSKNNEQQTIVNHIYGFQFNECQITNPTFQTIIPNDTTSEKPEVSHPLTEDMEQDKSVPPKSLCTTEAQEILESLCSGNILDNHWQPIDLSNTEKGILASLLANRLNIGNLWQTFGNLWNIKPETLRTYYNRGMNQKYAKVFIERIKHILVD